MDDFKSFAYSGGRWSKLHQRLLWAWVWDLAWDVCSPKDLHLHMPCVQQDHISQWQGWGTQKAMQLVQAHVHLMQNDMQWQRIWISMCKEIICPCCGSICKTVYWNTCFWETTAVFELDIKAKRSCVPLHHGPSQCPWLLVFLYLFAPTSAFPLNKQE